MAQTFISIGTGKGQLKLIQAAHERGFWVVGVDRERAEDCAPFLREQILLSTYQTEEVVKAVLKIKDNYDFIGVLARTSGPALLTAAHVADALGIEGVSKTFGECSVSKSALREDAASIGISTPKGFKTSECVDPPFDLPWVVKPDAPLVGKKNVYAISNRSEYAEAFSAASQESYNGLVEVEELIEGIDVGYMAVLSDGKVMFDLLYDEYVSFPNGRAEGIGVGGPSIFVGSNVETRIKDCSEHLLKKWTFTAGFAFFSFRVCDEGQVYLYEANPGLCGDNIADQLLPCIWPGFDPFETEVLAVGGKVLTVPGQPSGLHLVLGGATVSVDSEDDRLKALSNHPNGAALVDRFQILKDAN